jgi:hypothetical protein
MISWLGEAVAIKEPTAAVFRDQSGANLLIVGQQEESALGLMAAALIGLGTQQAPDRTAFFVLDGTPQDSPLFGQLSQVCKVLPHRVTQGNWREAATVLGELAAEVNRRQQAPGELYPALFLLINGLQRFRELRRSEDDFGLPRRGEERSVSPAQQLATLLREGPGLGIHVLVWCDSLNNLNRSFDRPSLRELEMRVLFQMNAADSSTLIDNPLASKLGVHRALFHSEDRSVPEKFRPYGLPTEEWLSWVKQRLCERLKGSKPDQT